MGVGNLIFDSSAFSKSSLNTWKLLVHILLKPGLENFENNFASIWDKYNCAVQLNILWHCFFFGIGMKPDLSQSCGHCWAFQTCWHIKCSTFTALSFRILKQLNRVCYFDYLELKVTQPLLVLFLHAMCMSITNISILNADMAMSSRFVQSTAYRKIICSICNSTQTLLYFSTI